MSETTTEKPSALALFNAKIQKLDQFAEANSLATLTEGKGAFQAAIELASAMGELRALLTDDVMQPIMALQGSALGFRTDKDRDGKYPVEVVRDVTIEAVLKGFKMVGNQVNIIANRFYATKEGFEDWIRVQGLKGRLLDFVESYTIPKLVSADDAHVFGTCSYKWLGKGVEMKDVPFSIRVNKGQGADAIVGKAKRKLKAMVYARCTGTTVSDADLNDGAIDIQAGSVTTVDAGGGASTPKDADKPIVEMATAEQLGKLAEIIGPHDDAATVWLRAHKRVAVDQTWRGVTKKFAAGIIDKPKEFLAAIQGKA